MMHGTINIKKNHGVVYHSFYLPLSRGQIWVLVNNVIRQFF